MKMKTFVFTALAAVCAYGNVVLTGDTSRPANSCFAKGEKAFVTLAASGLAANGTRALTLGIYDHADRPAGEVKGTLAADAAGRACAKFQVPTEKYGFYRVRVKGGVLPQVGTRPAGFLTYAVLPDPALRPVLSQEDAFFGLHGNASGEADLMPWLGVRQRMGGVEPGGKRDASSWKRYGYNVCSRLESWRPLLSFFDAGFREKTIRAKNITWTIPLVDQPGGPEALGAAMRRYAARTKADWPEVIPHRIYEIFWEPDLTMDSPEQLVRAAKIVYEAIHASDPDAIVAGPTFSNAGSYGTLRKCLELGLGRYIDAFAIHCYNAFPPEANRFLSNIRRVKALLREFVGRDIPLIGTENGYLAVATREEEYLQMTGHVRSQLILLGEGFWFNCPFYGYDHHSNCKGDYGLAYNLEMKPGKTVWGPKKVSPRPALAALSAASLMLDGYRPTCTIEWLGETVLGYAYQNKAGDCRIALWDFGGTGEVAIPVGKGCAGIADMMGNTRPATVKNGELKLTLNAEPVYVLGVDPSVWGKDAQAKLKWSERRFRSADADAPVQIARIAPSFAGGCTGVRVELENTRTGTAVKGEVEARIRGIPEARRTAAFEIGPGRTAGFHLPMKDFRTDPYTVHDVEITVAPAKGMRVQRRAGLNFLPARKMATWDGLVPRPAPARKGRNGFTIKDAADCSVEFATGWNERYLFMAFTVTDDEFSNVSRGAMTWRGDAIQLGLAKDPFVKPSPNSYADDLNRALTEMTLALTSEGPSAWRTMTFDDRILPSGRNGKIDPAECPLEVFNEKTPSGVKTHYRVAVPWKFLNIGSARAGDVVWFAAMINDQDADTMRTELKSCSLDLFDLKQSMPRKFGAVTLCGE